MSLCRWSSMNWSCDLYIYEGCDGKWHTHVAHNRIMGDIPQVDNTVFMKDIYTEELGKIWMEQNKVQMTFLESCERKPIGLKYDGQSFVDDKETLLGRLKILKDEGYNFPHITEEDLE